MTIELVLRDHLNRTAQERFKVPRQRKTLSKQVIASIEIHQKIDIAIGSLGAAMPVFLTLGNHDGETGTRPDMSAWSAAMRSAASEAPPK